MSTATCPRCRQQTQVLGNPLFYIVHSRVTDCGDRIRCEGSLKTLERKEEDDPFVEPLAKSLCFLESDGWNEAGLRATAKVVILNLRDQGVKLDWIQV